MVSTGFQTYELRQLREINEMKQLLRVAGQVWGTPADSMVSSDFLMALAHSGGFVAGAYEGTNMVACSFGMLARHGGDWCLHSHITGVLPSIQNSGIGTRMKLYQRQWAIDNDLTAITWTFDPLVRRNGWFNIQRLGATAVEYHINFYGPLGDDINGNDESDRLLARWDLQTPRVVTALRHGLPVPIMSAAHITVATPEDIISLRHLDKDQSHEWRINMRQQLSKLLQTHDVTAMTTTGSYVLTLRDGEMK